MICVSVVEKNPESVVQIANSAEMAEIRIDLCELDENTVKSVFSNISHPTIATCRPDYCNDEQRSLLLKTAILSGACYVDVEIESATEFKNDIISFAHEHGCKVIISYHNYENTPSIEELRNIIDTCFSQKADIAKVATTALSQRDSAVVLSLYAEYENLVALAMGENGKISRIANVCLGSPFTFVAIDKQHCSAAGQLTAAQMQTILNNFK